MVVRQLSPALAVAFLLSGCASTPREFAPVAAAKTADGAVNTEAPAVPDAVLAECRRLAAAGQTNGFLAEKGASTGVGVATGAAAGAAVVPLAGLSAYIGMAAVGTGALGVAAGAGAVAAGAIAAPVALGAGAAYGVSRAVRHGREKKLKTAMQTCLAEHGHQVSRWEVVKR